MSLSWKSTINNAYINPKRLPAALEQTIPSLIKNEIQHLANLSLFQKNVLSSNVNISQVPVYLKVTKDSLNVRVSKEGSWISLLPTSLRALTPEEKAVDAVRQDVMKKIALFWSEASYIPPTKSVSEESSPGSSFLERNQGIDPKTHSKRNKGKSKNYKESSTIISRNKVDCSTHTINNYYCCSESTHRLSHTTGKEQNVQNFMVDANTQTYQSNTDSLEDESKHRSANSFSGKHQRKDGSSNYSDTSELENSSDEQSDLASTDSFSEITSVINRAADFTEHAETIPIDSLTTTDTSFINHGTVETFLKNTHSEETLDNDIEKDFVMMPSSSELTEEMQYIPSVKTRITSRIQAIWENIRNINLFNSKTWNVTDLLEPTFAQSDLQNDLKKDSQISAPEPVKTFSENSDSEEALDNGIEETFVMVASSELTEEMQYIPPAESGIKSRIQNIWKNLGNLTLFNSKNQNVTNDHQTTLLHSDFDDHSDSNSQIEDEFEVIDRTETVKKPGDKRTIASFETDTRNIEASSDDQFENIDIDNEEDTESTFKNTFDYLFTKTTSPLRPGVTSEYLYALKNQYPNFIYDDRLMYGNIPVSMDTIIAFLTDLKIQNPGNQVIFLPFLVKGWTVDHAVVAVVNLSNETIEYFDPKGQGWINTRIEKQSNKNVFDFLTQIGEKVISPTFSKENIVYNKNNVPQGIFDNINCGVFCLQFIEERLSHSFDSIENGIVGKLTNPVHIRHQLAKKFQERFETKKIDNFFIANSLHSSEEEKLSDSLSLSVEDTEKSNDTQTADSYEFIPSSDIQNIPLSPMSTITQSSPPLFLTPQNPFHLGKYSQILRTIKENFSKFSSDTNLNSLKAILHQDNLDSREKYRRYVDELRKLLQDTTLADNTRTNLEKLCYAEFTTNVMTNFIEHFLQQATDHKLLSPSELTMHTIAGAIIATNNQLKDSPLKKALIALYSQKLAGELGINFDPIKYSNIPEIRSIHTVRSSSKKDPYQIIYMRHGTPTVETGLIQAPQETHNFLSYRSRQFGGTFFKNYQANTIPEYGAFLNRARDVNKPVFYVNHQNTINRNSAEYSRSRAIQNHETTHPNHFFFMTLPLDGRILDHVESTDQWKKELIKNLLNEQNGFILPAKLKNDFAEDKQILEDQFKNLLDRLHDLYFANQPLSHTDQQTLLMIFYSYLKDFVKERYQIQIMVSACKDNKDRGNTSSSIDEALYNLRLGKENDSNALYDLYIRFFAPFIIKYDHIIPHRFQLLISVLQHISTLTDTQKETIRQFQINNFEILDQKVPR